MNSTTNQRSMRELVDVRRRPTVVRLEHLDDGSDWITDSYFITGDVEKHLNALRESLSRKSGIGIFLIGQYGSGKSHFLAYVIDQLRHSRFVPDGPVPHAISLLNFRSELTLESIVCEELKIATDESDRRVQWAEVRKRYPSGLVLLFDELSEFLRSKQDPQSYNEDIRFLQFLGEWTQGNPFWVIGSMQEEIEHTGKLEHGIYRKIKDRYPIRFLLTSTHVKDLIAGSILNKQPGYEVATAELVADLKRSFPKSQVDYEQLAEIYPVHPATLDVLREVRDRFSQARGVVDFVVSQLAGDPTRGIKSFLDRDWGNLLSPDTIVDHFQDLFELQPEFQPIAQQLFPYYRKNMDELFSTPAQSDLGWRVLKLLILDHLSPSRNGLTVTEAVQWLQYRVVRLNPEKNISIVQRMLDTLADHGRHVVVKDQRYALQLDDDGGASLERFLQQYRSKFSLPDDETLSILASHLPDDGFHGFSLPRNTWQARSLKWHFHEKTFALFSGNEPPTSRDELTLVVRLPWGKPEPAAGHNTLIPKPLEIRSEHIELAALSAARERSWSPDVTRKLNARFSERVRLFETEVRNAYLDATLRTPNGSVERVPRAEGSFTDWLSRCVEVILKRVHPSFENYAPVYAALPKEAYRALMRFATQQDFGDPTSDEFVGIIREAYLVPMKLMRRHGSGYVFTKHPDRNELVRAVRSLIDCQPAPQVVYTHLAESVYGLVPDQVSLLLIVLLILGEIDIVKDRKSYRDAYETLPNPIQYDRIVPGTALTMQQLRKLSSLCEGVGVRAPDQWTVLSQRRIARELMEVGQKHSHQLQALVLKLREQGQAEALCDRIQATLLQWSSLEKGDNELQGLQQFLFEIPDPDEFSDTMNELVELPGKIDRLVSDLQRLNHLLEHPAVQASAETEIQSRIETLGAPPELDRIEALSKWLEQARELYRDYQQRYRDLHEQWWKECKTHELWSWQPPKLAQSRHMGLADDLQKWGACRLTAQQQQCQGLVNLDFQPICNCGFDGEKSPIEETFVQFNSIRENIEQTTAHFFAQEQVKSKMRQWVDDQIEVNPQTLAYVDGTELTPQISNLELFDDYLGGLELVSDVDVVEVVKVLRLQTWDRRMLVQSLDKLFARFGDTRLRFPSDGDDSPLDIVKWCLARTLETGHRLPGGISGDLLSEAVDLMTPDLVTSKAISRLEDLGIGDIGIQTILFWITEGQVKVTNFGRLPTSVAAALDLVQPTSIESPDELANHSEKLFLAHHQIVQITKIAWLTRLDEVARSNLSVDVPEIADVLKAQMDAQWLVIDCMGLALRNALRSEFRSLFPGWQVESEGFALVSTETTTDSFYRELLNSDVAHSFEKTNVVDELLHARFLPFAEMQRIIMAELSSAIRSIRKRLDKDRPLLVFADHGFRISTDGKSYTHGGNSKLERIVPTFRLSPKKR